MSKLTNDDLTRSGLYSCTQMATVGTEGLTTTTMLVILHSDNSLLLAE